MIHYPTQADSLRVLLVEDHKGDAMLIEKTLQQAMMGVITIAREATLAGALKQLAFAQFDVVLLDRSLPDVEGFNGLHSIQNFIPSAPVIFLTAYQDEQTAFAAIQEGAQDYLFKDQLDTHTIKRAIHYAALRKQFEEALMMRASFDGLTGLVNRTIFTSRLELALARIHRHGGLLSVLFLDLNNFKPVNDQWGHAMGDMLLKEVAERMKHVLRPYDTAARFGGDEFAILLENISEVSSADFVAHKIAERISSPMLLENHRFHVTASIGLTLAAHYPNTPQAERPNAKQLMQQADQAMYHAKKMGMAIAHYEEAMESAVILPLKKLQG